MFHLPSAEKHHLPLQEPLNALLHSPLEEFLEQSQSSLQLSSQY